MSEVYVKKFNKIILQNEIVWGKEYFYRKILFYTICNLNTPVKSNIFDIIIRRFTLPPTFLKEYLYTKW